MDFFGIGMMEVVFILLIAFLVFGPRRLPEIARGLGKAVREIKKYSTALTSDLQDEFNKELNTSTSKPVSTDKQTNKPQASGDTVTGAEIASHKTEEVQPLNKNE